MDRRGASRFVRGDPGRRVEPQGLRLDEDEHQDPVPVRGGRHRPRRGAEYPARRRIGLPDYYEWRTRSGCYFCFYQRKAEWIGLSEKHPELFERAVAIEQKVLQDAGVDGDADFGDRAMRGRQYTWSGGETLVQLRARRDQILERHDAAMARASKTRTNLPLIEALAEAFDEEDDTQACTVCAL